MGRLLVGDVGATKVLLSAYEAEADLPLAQKRYLSADFPSLTALIQTFQQTFSLPHFDIACLGLPGPVTSSRVHLTNLPWVVDAEALAATCHIDQVMLENDFTAAAWGLNLLSIEEMRCLQVGKQEVKGNRLIVGAGTGLGVAPIKNCDGNWIPEASEGGHMDFAPANAEQFELLQVLENQWTHVSYERLLSGKGLERLYAFYHAKSLGEWPALLKTVKSAQQVHAQANAGEPIARQAMKMFVEIYGAYIGNLALFWSSKAGIYIAGGIAPKIYDWLQQPYFKQAMTAKGRLSNWVQSMPVYLVMSEEIGLLGAYYLAKQKFENQIKMGVA